MENRHRALEEFIMLDVEYSYFPRWPLDPQLADDEVELPSNLIIMNRDLCSEEEKAALARLV